MEQQATQSTTLLNEAAQLWTTARDRYRDAAVAVGKLLYRYVVAHLQEADKLNAVERQERGLTRARAIKQAAKRLQLRPPKITELIQTAMVVDLLAAGQSLGTLSFTCLRQFRVVVHRVHRGKHLERAQRPHRSKEEQDKEYVTPSQLEEWGLRAEYTWAPALFRRAVAENWDAQRIRTELLRQLPLGRPNAWKEDRVSDKSRLVDLEALAKGGSTRDLADLIADLIRRSTDPVTLAELVRSRLPMTQRKAS